MSAGLLFEQQRSQMYLPSPVPMRHCVQKKGLDMPLALLDEGDTDQVLDTRLPVT